MALTAQQHAFILEFPKDWNGTQAAIRAGISESNASTQAYRWLSNAEIYQAIEDRKADLAAAAGLSVEWVLRQWREIAEADPAELIYYEVQSCRHCYGLNHEFQWSEFEYKKAVQSAQEHRCNSKCEELCSKRIPPIPLGGFGFDPKRTPAADCPYCHGNGEGRIGIADVRRLKGAARRLYAGVKETQHGIEVKMRDQDTARDNIAKYLGMLIDKRELSGPNGGPLAMVGFTAADLSDDQLAQIIKQEE